MVSSEVVREVEQLLRDYKLVDAVLARTEPGSRPWRIAIRAKSYILHKMAAIVDDLWKSGYGPPGSGEPVVERMYDVLMSELRGVTANPILAIKEMALRFRYGEVKPLSPREVEELLAVASNRGRRQRCGGRRVAAVAVTA